MRTRFLIVALSTALSGAAAWAQVAPPPTAPPPSTEPTPPAKDRPTGARPGSLPATPPPTRETPTTTGPAVVQPGTPQTDLGHFYKVSSLPGMTVALGSESLGKVTEAVINDGGCVQYLVVQTGPDAFVAVPWGVATVDFARSAVSVRGAPGLTAEKIRAGAFARDNWPTFTDPVWSQRTTALWGNSTPRVGPRTGEPGAAPGAAPRTGTPRTASPGGAAVGPTPGSTPASGTPPPSPGTAAPGSGTTPGGTTPGTGTTPRAPSGTPPATPPGKGTGPGG